MRAPTKYDESWGTVWGRAYQNTLTGTRLISLSTGAELEQLQKIEFEELAKKFQNEVINKKQKTKKQKVG